jgi:hypothetical protein
MQHSADCGVHMVTCSAARRCGFMGVQWAGFTCEEHGPCVQFRVWPLDPRHDLEWLEDWGFFLGYAGPFGLGDLQDLVSVLEEARQWLESEKGR